MTLSRKEGVIFFLYSFVYFAQKRFLIVGIFDENKKKELTNGRISAIIK